MYDFSIAMALVDYIPVVFFAVSAVLMMRDYYFQLPNAIFRASFPTAAVHHPVRGSPNWKRYRYM